MTKPIPFGDDELFGLGELLQMTRLRGHSGSLVLRGPQGAAHLQFQGGSFAAASHTDLQATLTDLLQWRQGTAVLQRASPATVPGLLFDVEILLVQAVCALDERRATLGVAVSDGVPESLKRGGRLRRWLATRRWATRRGDGQFRVPLAPPCPLDA